MRILVGVLIALPYLLLLLLWGVGRIPTSALLPLITAPLAVRLGEVVSHRSDASPKAALREALVFAALFVSLLTVGLVLPW